MPSNCGQNGRNYFYIGYIFVVGQSKVYSSSQSQVVCTRDGVCFVELHQGCQVREKCFSISRDLASPVLKLEV